MVLGRLNLYRFMLVLFLSLSLKLLKINFKCYLNKAFEELQSPPQKLRNLWHAFLFVFYIVGDGTQGLVHARRALCHWDSYIPAPYGTYFKIH